MFESGPISPASVPIGQILPAQINCDSQANERPKESQTNPIGRPDKKKTPAAIKVAAKGWEKERRQIFGGRRPVIHCRRFARGLVLPSLPHIPRVFWMIGADCLTVRE